MHSINRNLVVGTIQIEIPAINKNTIHVRIKNILYVRILMNMNHLKKYVRNILYIKSVTVRNLCLAKLEFSLIVSDMEYF